MTLGGPPSAIWTPWTSEQVIALNRYQEDGRFHPFTCCNSDDQKHQEARASHGWVLVATADGWRCPVPGCAYTQRWAHAFMAEALPP